MTENLVDTRSITIGDASIPRIGFGCWRFVGDDVSSARERIEAALDSGMVLIDTADVYGFDWGGTGFGEAEELLGKVLAEAPQLRDRMFLATKGGIRPGVPYDSSEDYLRQACTDSMRRLGVDVLDLYQIHRPDAFTHPGEVADALSRLVADGLVKEVGVSNYTAGQTETLLRYIDVDLATSQPEFSAAHLDPMHDGTFDTCLQRDIAVLAWSPLAGGRLATGQGLRPELLAKVDELADREGVDRATIALGFVLAHPVGAVAIIGSQKPERIRAAAQAYDIHLDRNDAYDIIEASTGKPLP